MIHIFYREKLLINLLGGVMIFEIVSFQNMSVLQFTVVCFELIFKLLITIILCYRCRRSSVASNALEVRQQFESSHS